MFNSIRGIIGSKGSDTVFLETGGLEWEIGVPAGDIARLPPEGEEARLFTWLYHREDQMKLYGFADETRRATFLELLKVEGIGPKGAVRILGGISQEELEKALENEDLGRLEAVPGLGKKTAQKMLLALRGKLKFSSAAKADVSSPHGELLEALAGMGYDRRAAAEALAKADRSIAGENVTAAEREKLLFREAIVLLS
ncbi:MAG: Holliday junction branch migration protein RuvA [Treponema sp.]|jgi:Holliday junction DNA helicase RuvA|nr:Holliday junction branch migration protein RuvA [Treponema sp.]